MTSSQPLREALHLEPREYCAEDSTWSIQGHFPASVPELSALERRAQDRSLKTMFMKRLQVLYIMAGRLTVQFHQNGDIFLNGAPSPDEGIRFL